MPHVREQEYKVPSEDCELQYVEVIQRHHKRTPYASNTFFKEDITWDCSNEGPYHYAKDRNGLQTAPVNWQAQTGTQNPFEYTVGPGSLNSTFRVSPLTLKCASLGNQWTGWSGKGMDFEESSKLLDAFYEAGGNFIDVANNYQDEQSEMVLGEWMEKRGIRDEIVVATKFTSYPLARKEGPFEDIAINYSGNSRKSLNLSLPSLKKLRTNYIDVFYVHYWDHTTSIPELMQSLNELVNSRKVLYLGISIPQISGWVVAHAKDYAIQHLLAQFVIYQVMWNVQIKKQANWRGGVPPTEAELKVSQELQEIAEELLGGVKLANVALAWSRHMVADVFPLIEGSSIEHPKANIEALKIKLTEAQVDKLNNAYPFDWGFPHNFLGIDPRYLPGGKPAPNAVHLINAGEIEYTKLP
ncbi:hypothetical protein L198_06184 [Cryptococcus wingfieldii CBS 7118]|uniref:NADP-dependent oxidoreductase domain-containing protein n=1 Tax=Cryptococcus wingfieldii CBS 7118 TaxID=1295528 RepID=A0A1E3IQF4_9TREE|nr:hypothetical protein L198_06184 [Cryptococcus wingfieldii CBS 7118]ODN90166.1 hypothetical protein L198_06184 [Cryptococcus wingfieldii CBS 7118]